MAPQTTRTFFATPQAFRQWLERHAASAPELLVGFHKVGSGRPSMGWSESVDEALCFGWIDGIRRRLDEHTYSIRFTPRKPSSIWSAVNIAKVEQLQAAGRMTPAGLAAFAHRKAHKSAIYSHEQAGGRAARTHAARVPAQQGRVAVLSGIHAAQLPQEHAALGHVGQARCDPRGAVCGAGGSLRCGRAH